MKKYVEAKMEITEFKTEDVITTSTYDVGAGEGVNSGDRTRIISIVTEYGRKHFVILSFILYNRKGRLKK